MPEFLICEEYNTDASVLLYFETQQGKGLSAFSM